MVGFCAIRKIDDRLLELAGIIVRQDQLGKGVGNDLLEGARKLLAKGFDYVCQEVTGCQQNIM